jgi:ATP-dependent DNA helicase UvrD/PcrA
VRLGQDQQGAAALLEGAVRVVAGAGTGKTAVIAERFRRLVSSGVRPAEILVMTFTDRAAREMRARIEAATGEPAEAVGTFHSMAMGWLREDGSAVGLRPSFRILAGADRWIALRELMWEMGDPTLVADDRPDDLVAPLLKLLERLKQELVPLQRLEDWCAANPGDERSALLSAAARLFREHARRTRGEGLVDFDDLLVDAVRLLEGNPQLLSRYRVRHPHLMVDEYQDTNLAQERLVELLGQDARSVFVVGDDDQSIYRFRGAALASMNRFLQVFPGAQTLTLGRNRRSTRSIVASAAALIVNNAGRIEKDLRSTSELGAAVEIRVAANGTAEAAAIAGDAVRLHEAGMDWREIAVLCRTHAIARPIVEALRAAGVPHRQLGGAGVLDVPEVRDVIAMLRVLADPDDLVAIARCLVRPPLAVGLEPALAWLRQRDGDASCLASLASWPPARAWTRVMVQLAALSTGVGIDELFFELMSRTRLLDAHAGDDRALAAVTRFGELIDDFCAISRDHSLAAWMRRLDLLLLSGHDEDVDAALDSDDDAVRVMTIHQAKGLEFDAVLVPSLVEGRLPLPGRRSGFDLPAAILEPAVRSREDHLAEERRLTYVALTRARRRAVLSWARSYEGTRAWTPSRFLAELEAGGRTRQTEVPAAMGITEAASAVAGADGGERGDQVLSFSSIAAYRECPAQHRYRYRLRLPPAETAEGQYGTVVHAALMGAGRLRREGAEVTVEQIERLLEEEWARVEPVDVRRLPALRALSRRQLRAFVAAGGFAAAPERVEERFTTTIDGIRLQGIIDRIDGPRIPPPTQEGGEAGLRTVDEDAVWRLVDYKTGNPLPASRLRRDLQLALYALGARQELHLDPLELEIVYLKTGKRVVLPATEELFDEARRVILEVVSGIRSGRFEPRPDRRRCSLCAYRLACPSAL